jgi:hypothetical protein
MRVREWGISFDGSAAATPGIIELCVTDVAATVTAHAAAGSTSSTLRRWRRAIRPPTCSASGTTSTGYTASGEGTVGAVRQGDVQLVAPTNQYVFQFPLGAEFLVNPAEFMRIRVKFGAAINAICYILADM